MSMLCGKYVKTFEEATHAILDGVSLNAPYPFFWLEIEKVEGREIVCRPVGGEARRLKFQRTKTGDRSSIVMSDPIFGDCRYPVLPFRDSDTAARK